MRPWVVVNMAVSVDGKITSATREKPAFTSRSDRYHVDRLRAWADALIIGAGTLNGEDPPVRIQHAAHRQQRKAEGRPPGLVHVVCSASARVLPTARLFCETESEGKILATSRMADAESVAALPADVEIWQLGDTRVDATVLVQRLADRGVHRILLEGGGALNWTFLAADLVSELYVTVCPTLLGGAVAPTMLDGAGWPMAAQRRLRLKEVRPSDEGELFCHYSVLRSE